MQKQMLHFMILNAGLVRIWQCGAAEAYRARSESAPVCEPLQWQWITDGLWEEAEGVEQDF